MEKYKNMIPQQNYIVFLIISCYLINIINTQLLINVKNQGGDVVQENIAANVTDSTVILEFQRSDGTLVTQLIDFASDVQILKALVLGEEERGQSQYQVMCFVCHFQKNEFISADAMSKLRQKNPGTVRMPEEDRGRDNYTMDYFVDISRSGVISRHIATLCAEAANATYIRRQDLLLWASQPGASESQLMSAVRAFPGGSMVPSCKDTTSIKLPCQCHIEMCIGWYPCALKYCKGKEEIMNASMSYRCGIKTCKKCFLFSYFVHQKQICLWDE